jgi:NAD(P)-dependent dehydrogenase (short-subunit alcohol dehydrogenase family)
MSTGVLDGRAIVVTGAGRGLGRAYALEVAREGASVVVNDIDAEGAAEVVDEIVAGGGRAIASTSTVADWEAAGQVVAACVEAFGAIDGLVNNAGVAVITKSSDLTQADAATMVEVNLLGSIYVGTHAIRAMQAAGTAGAIVNATSSAQLGIAGMAVYGATKGALASLTYGWALDLADTGIRVNAFSPVADTAMSWMADIPVGTLPSPEANAPAVAFLLSDLAGGVTGQVVQFRPPNRLEVVSHPAMTGHDAPVEELSAAGVADAFAGVLRDHAQPNGWGIGRS